MTSAQVIEAQARLNVCLREVVSFFEAAGVQSHSLDLLNDYVEKHMTFEFLELAEAFGKCNAFIDHDLLMSLLLLAWNTLSDGCMVEKKQLTKKIKILKEDKKTDQEYLARQENLLADVDQRKALVLVSCIRLKTMASIPLDLFKRDPKFEYMKHHTNLKKHAKDLMVSTKK